MVDDGQLKDGPNEVWDGDLIAQKVSDCINQLISENANDADGMEYNLNLLTFDRRGVSSHPNHIDTFKGVRYLLHEKAKHSCIKGDTISSQWTLVNGKHKVHMNLQIWILNTISNPLQKYFFWVLWDLLPQLLLLLLQILWQLAMFLLGSSLWSKSKKEYTSPLTGTRSTSTTIQYRIMEPILAWQAMAAHHSQFVWYRRLSVLFSRYTFINEFIKLLPDESYLTYQEDEDTLPPISISQESDSKFLLSVSQMNSIREIILPPSLQLRPWKRIYSLSRDGDSFITFQKLVGDWNKDQHCTLLVVKTTKGDVIGGYASVPFVSTVKHPAGGEGGTCLFKVQDLDVVVYGKNNGGHKRVVLDATRRLVAFGGGTGDGGDDGFGLSLNDGFLRGTTARCEAFDNDPLVDGDDVFEVTDVEVWGFVFGQL